MCTFLLKLLEVIIVFIEDLLQYLLLNLLIFRLLFFYLVLLIDGHWELLKLISNHTESLLLVHLMGHQQTI